MAIENFITAVDYYTEELKTLRIQKENTSLTKSEKIKIEILEAELLINIAFAYTDNAIRSYKNPKKNIDPDKNAAIFALNYFKDSASLIAKLKKSGYWSFLSYSIEGNIITNINTIFGMARKTKDTDLELLACKALLDIYITVTENRKEGTATVFGKYTKEDKLAAAKNFLAHVEQNTILLPQYHEILQEGNLGNIISQFPKKYTSSIFPKSSFSTFASKFWSKPEDIIPTSNTNNVELTTLNSNFRKN